MNDRRQSLIDMLEKELYANTAFVRIHAAEALVEHGFGFKAATILRADVDTKTPGYRTGVWRVLARIAPNEEERGQYTERIRRVMLDPAAPDRVGAAESLAKLGVSSRADRGALTEWLAQADAASAPFPLWVLFLSGHPAERVATEASLASLLEATDPIARLRAGFALGRIRKLSPESIAHLQKRAASEPADSPARLYLITAAFLHTPRGSAEAKALKNQFLPFFTRGKANEQYEAATVLGLHGSALDLPTLTELLKSPEADARIGAAGAVLHLVQ